MRVTDRHDMTLAVKVAFTPIQPTKQPTNQPTTTTTITTITTTKERQLQ